jgi:uncharacterized protein (DUF4415 family)
VSNKPIKKIDWDKVDTIPENSYDYEGAPELTEEMMQIAFIRQPILSARKASKKELYMKINKQIQKEIEALANMPDSDIDYSDIPEVDSQTKFTRVSNKQFNEFMNSEISFDKFVELMNTQDAEMVSVNIRLNREVVDFFKQHSKKYQVKINETLLMLVHQYKQQHH